MTDPATRRARGAKLTWPIRRILDPRLGLVHRRIEGVEERLMARLDEIASIASGRNAGARHAVAAPRRRTRPAHAAADDASRPEPAVSHNSVACFEHFDSPELAPYLEEIWAPISPDGTGWRAELADRKSWEVAMALRALREHGALHEDAEVLGVGAGAEATVFVLTNHVRRVFATDLYLEPGDWGRTAQTSMLARPERFWSGVWEPDRLVVQHMDALDLRYEEGSFDAIFSSSSLEHFGTHDDTRTALREMHRVLKPGGLCSISTEFRLDGPPPGLPGINMFDRRDIEELLIGSADWATVGGAPRFEPSPRTMSVVTPFEQAAQDVEQGRPRWSQYPHLVLDTPDGPRTWTSIHLALRKPR